MKIFKKFCNHLSDGESAALVFDLATLVPSLLGNPNLSFIDQCWYLWALITISDFIAVAVPISYGAVEAPKPPDDRYGLPLIRFTLLIALGICVCVGNTRTAPVKLAVWCLATAVSVFRNIAVTCLTINHFDQRWLAGTNGQLGLPNLVSIFRIVISLFIPWLYATASFGLTGKILATVLLIIAIGSDYLDGIIARRQKQITRLGKILDPVGDKVVFYGSGIGILLTLSLVDILSIDHVAITAIIISIILIILRDTTFTAFYLIAGRNMHREFQANKVDKLRMLLLCIGLLTATALSFIPTAASLVVLKTCFFSIYLAGALSIGEIIWYLNHPEKLGDYR